MQTELQPLNRFGHMQSIINYTKWLLETNKTPNAVNDFFTCQQVRQSIDQEMHSQGSYSLLSESRKPKQEAFQALGNQLARLPVTDKKGYEETIRNWQKNLNNESGNLLSYHRLFNNKKTHSELVIEANLNSLKA